VAQAAYEELALDRLYFVPAAQSPFKQASQPAPGGIRERLLHLALAGKPWCEVDSQELQREGVSFAVETLRDYAARFPNAELFYLIGADNAATLPQWRAAEDLARLAQFIVIPRPGQADSPVPNPFRGSWLKGWPLAVSSSDIRARIRAGKTIGHLVPAAVAEAIRNNRLYL